MIIEQIELQRSDIFVSILDKKDKGIAPTELGGTLNNNATKMSHLWCSLLLLSQEV
jgi:hypothetical protein